MEMGRINGGVASYGRSAKADPMGILNETTEVDQGIEHINQNLAALRELQREALNDTDASPNTKTNRQLDSLSTETMDLYRNLVGRIKKLKNTPGAGSEQNAKQVGRVERRLKDAIQNYQTLDAEFRKELQAQMARQYLIVRPTASKEEVDEAVGDTSSTQVFGQAVSNPSLSLVLSFG